MKQYLLFLLIISVTNTFSQSKRVQAITDYERGEFYSKVSYTYDSEGRLSRSDFQGEDGPGDQLIMDFMYEGNTITIDVGGTSIRDLSRSVIHLDQGRATSMEVYGVGGDGKTPDYSDCTTYQFEYDGNGQITRVDMDYDTVEMTWSNGNLIKAHGMEKDERSPFIWTYDYEFGDQDNPTLNPFFFEILEDFVEYNLVYTQHYLPQYFGKRSKKLISKLTDHSSEGSKTSTRVYVFSYVLDSDGDIKELIIVREDRSGEYIHYYVDYEGTSGISHLTHDSGKIQAIYDMGGVKRDYISKGMNIIKHSDGTTSKIVIK